VPHYDNGTIQYIIMSVVATSDFYSGWVVKELPQRFAETSSVPEEVLTATSGEDNSKGGSQQPGFHWSGKNENLE